MSKTRLTICVGGGGVGKTTTSAALALQMARAGSRSLVITVDPARRLADALGAEVGQATRPAPIDPRAGGRLFAKMPDPRSSMDDFTQWLFLDPERRDRFRANPAVKEMADSIAGIHEILTIALLQHEVDSGNFDEVVLDTAPSRHALAFLTYPQRLLGMLEAKALAWLAQVAEVARPDEAGEPPKTGLLAWGRSKVEALFGRVLGVSGLRDLSSMFADLASVRERWAEVARRTQELLGDPRTRYLLVGAPTGGAIEDVTYLMTSLERRKLRPTAVVLNRAEREPPACEQGVLRLLDSRQAPIAPADEAVLRETLKRLAHEHHAREAAADEASKILSARLPRSTPIIRLPFVGPAPPNEIVLALADEWAKVKGLLARRSVAQQTGQLQGRRPRPTQVGRRAPNAADGPSAKRMSATLARGGAPPRRYRREATLAPLGPRLKAGGEGLRQGSAGVEGPPAVTVGKRRAPPWKGASWGLQAAPSGLRQERPPSWGAAVAPSSRAGGGPSAAVAGPRRYRREIVKSGPLS